MLTLRTTFTFAAPEPSLGATASTTRRMSRCIMRTKSRCPSRWATSHSCSIKYIMFARLFIEFCYYQLMRLPVCTLSWAQATNSF